MSQGKYDFLCPKCNEVRGYTLKKLEEGVCRNCGRKFTPEQRKEIEDGIKSLADDRKVTQVDARLKRK
jgi:hypothetical protein